ncbi:MAG: dethiobiotin synthase [Chitinispirillales bacterium]|jgi:dethiobiotin synthase|nr:dethiobiotin synthase [Chitinispirillales bacterium]
MATKGVFITGSGTAVGKTYVSALLLKGFSELGHKTTYMKPVETGCEDAPLSDKTPVGVDTLYALKFASCKTDFNLHSPYRFSPACSPHLAARIDGSEIKVENIVLTYGNLNKNTAANIVLVEGAGGLLVPVNDKEYITDVIKALGIPVILVVTPGLGTLNHTFLSLRVLEQYKIPVAGIVINNAQNIKRNFIYEDNVNTIRLRTSPIPCLNTDYNAQADNKLTEFCDEVIARL